MIGPFTGEFAFLSNFWDVPVMYDGQMFPTAECAFQAAKTLDPNERKKILLARTPGKAKRLGRKVKLRPGWNSMRIDVMRQILLDKFTRNLFCMHWLIATGDEELVEVNDWGDRFWGVCEGKGENWLGKLLMEIRSEVREKGKEDLVKGEKGRLEKALSGCDWLIGLGIGRDKDASRPCIIARVTDMDKAIDCQELEAECLLVIEEIVAE
jgi:ribA/ribD-fused uncharacterized protein